MHAMNTRFVVQFNRFPQLRAIRGGHQVKHGAILNTLAKIPLTSDRDFTATVPIDVSRRNANVIPLGEITSDDMLGPTGVLVPLDRTLVGQHDIRLAVAIDIGDLQSVTDLDRINLNGFPLVLRDGLRSE